MLPEIPKNELTQVYYNLFGLKYVGIIRMHDIIKNTTIDANIYYQCQGLLPKFLLHNSAKVDKMHICNEIREILK